MVDITISEILSSYSSATKINSNFEAAQDGLADALSMSNGGALGDILDMDSNSIINLPDPVLDHEPATKAYVDEIIDTLVTEGASNVDGILDLGAGWDDALKAPIDADLTALSGLTTTGLITRTGAGTMTTRTLTGTANELTVTNGDGVSGAPTISLPSSLIFTGKTVNGGTLASPTLSGSIPGTPSINSTWTFSDTQLMQKGITITGLSGGGVVPGAIMADSSGGMYFRAAFAQPMKWLKFSDASTLMSLSNTGALQLPSYTSGVMLSDGSGNLTSSTTLPSNLLINTTSNTGSSMTWTIGSSGSPIATDATFGYAGNVTDLFFNSQTAGADAHHIGTYTRSTGRAGEKGIAVGLEAHGVSSGTHASGSSFESGAIGISANASTTVGSTVFAGSFNVGHDTATGGLVRGIEIDSFCSTAPLSKILVELVSPNTDTGAATGSVTVQGGNTISDSAFIRMSRIGGGTGVTNAIVAVQSSGGTAPIPTTGAVIRSGGYTSACGWDARDHAFSEALILGGNDQQLVSGRNAANSANVKALRVAGDNTVVLGDQFVVNPTNGDTSTPGTGTFTKGVIIAGLGGGGAVPGTIGKDANYGMIFRPNTTVAAQADYLWMDYGANTVMRLGGSASSLGSGLVLGAPTGGFKGLGTLNAVGVYDDNTLLTDLVLDQAVDGYFDTEKYADHPIKDELTDDWFDLDKYADHWTDKRCLPGMVQFTPEDKPSTGELITRLTAVVETQAVLIEKLNQRIKALENH